ncbi:DUF6631 family protein [Marilutibacter aestuarii]|uniref:Uncharacterized protein n=1 Tax=Marilutibacter aestuarii TaxID=1706195 RepID=A0A508AM97_9GAMM|nr:DUF6631 family protein [Lysobacter aestuarii]TQD51240.1 hypothetical protein FKV25_02070 [Lysobacter aestuarii]
MARKLPREDTPPAAPATESPAVPDSGTAGLDTLAPDFTTQIAGREVTFREYGFLEGLGIAERASDLIADMVTLCADGTMRYARVRRLFGKHRAVVVPIAADSAGVEADWIERLEPADSELFFSTWFTVNSGFFVREVAVDMRDAALAAAHRASTGSSSSPGSRRPGSETTTASGDSPSVN